MARQGQHAEGLRLLDSILKKDPKNYPVRRDYVVIATWAGRCDQALEYYKPIANAPNQETYLAVPVAACLDEAGESERAVKLLSEVNRRGGDDESQDALRRIKRKFALENKPVLDVAAATTKSDAGSRDWHLSARLKDRINAQWSWYVRFLHVRADDPDFDTGDFHRLGAGLIFGINRKVTLIQDFAAELHDGSDFGSTTTLVFSPTFLINSQVEYATFAEDIPLRARAEGTDARRFTASIDYHTPEYRWEAGAGIAYYDFSDGNNRYAQHGSIGYAFELAQKREQRLILGVANSMNSKQGVVYYNPEHDFTSTLTYKLDLVYDSRFPRHVDHIYVWTGGYRQHDYGTAALYGVRYEQDYDFDDQTSATWGTSLRSSIYDGNRETEFNINASLTRKL